MPLLNFEVMKAKNLIIGQRKDQQGRNNVNTLRYYAGFMRLLERGYKNLSIHEKITVRSAYCGNEFPSVMISTLN